MLPVFTVFSGTEPAFEALICFLRPGNVVGRDITLLKCEMLQNCDAFHHSYLVFYFVLYLEKKGCQQIFFVIVFIDKNSPKYVYLYFVLFISV